MDNPIYALAHDTWGKEEKDAIQRVVDSGRYTMGKEVEGFENVFNYFFSNGYTPSNCIMVNSGSSANLIGLAAWKYTYNIPDGSEIIVPAVSWSTTYFPITQLNLVPIFVDVDLMTFNISPSRIAEAVTNKTRAIFAVNLLGNPCDYDAIKSIQDEHRDIHLLEDNCESMGAMYRSSWSGTKGKFGTFSFFFSHHIQTMEGGMIFTHDAVLADYARSLRAHGWTRDLRTKMIYEHDGDHFGQKFKFITPGYCVRPLEMEAAVGKVQLKRFPNFLSKRRANAETFKQLFTNGPKCVRNIQWETDKSSWFGFGIILKQEYNRSVVCGYLNNLGIETRPIVAGNFLNQPVVDKYIIKADHPQFHIRPNVPNAEIIDKHGFFVGNDDRDLTLQLKLLRELLSTF